MSFIRHLSLNNFRSYDQASVSDLQSGAIVLHGANGAGKTNILEAVSLLSPGKGLRGARIGDIERVPPPHPLRGAPNPLPAGEREAQTPALPTPSPLWGEGRGEGASWAISAEIESLYGPIRIGTGRDPASDKRIVRINGEAARGQAALAEYLSCVWLTPQMDRLFLDTASSRRRFLDRLVFAFDPGHSGRVSRYENGVSQRARLLRDQPNPDAGWLSALEATIAESAIAITAARLEFTVRLQQAADSASSAETSLFPRARFAIDGAVETMLRDMPALEAEDIYKTRLRQARGQDTAMGGASFGPHRSDLSVVYAAKSMPAAHCSTGEQKALLIGIILAHARLIAAERGSPPILLLDEVAAHLDEARRAALYGLLMALGGQVWLTGTDLSLFESLTPFSPQIFAVADSAVFPPVTC